MFSFGKKSIVLTLLLFILIAAIGWAWKQRDSLPFVTSPLNMAATPFEFGTSRIVSSMSIGVSVVDTALKKRVEWENLENKIAALEIEKSRYEEIYNENLRLRSLLDFKTTHPQFDLLGAVVIGKDYGTWSNTIIINRGSNNGVTKYMPIIVPAGVVGFVSDVYPYSARVQLMLDPRSAVGARVQRAGSRVTSVVRGDGNNPSVPRFVNLGKEADVLEGDVLLTSGLGGVYPKGLMIGTIISVEPDPNGVVKSGAVKMAVDFNRLEEVFILLRSREVAPTVPALEQKLVPKTSRDEVQGAKGAEASTVKTGGQP